MISERVVFGAGDGDSRGSTNGKLMRLGPGGLGKVGGVAG